MVKLRAAKASLYIYLDGALRARPSPRMDSDTLQVDWAAGEVADGEMRIPATFEGLSGMLILSEGEMLAATKAADDEVLIAFGGMIGWIADAAQKAFARGALVQVDGSFLMLIAAEDFSLTRPTIN
ncbi:hypothetical protein [Sphingobium sp. DN12]|uniref:hypothetical protein n=1 Tax=Sphingobium sp. DN12 TaxID=3378073 RepID=UPI003DA2E92E